jgi:ribose 5-phosphate isomerase B
MKVLIASDHAGFDLKKYMIQELSAVVRDLELIDLGPDTSTKSVDYPDYSRKLCEALTAGKGEYGILICGSGQGMAMQANRFKGIRAALCWDLPSAKFSRLHNDANVLCLGGRLIPFGYAIEIAKLWLETTFEGGRHLARIKKFDELGEC